MARGVVTARRHRGSSGGGFGTWSPPPARSPEHNWFPHQRPPDGALHGYSTTRALGRGATQGSGVGTQASGQQRWQLRQLRPHPSPNTIGFPHQRPPACRPRTAWRAQARSAGSGRRPSEASPARCRRRRRRPVAAAGAAAARGWARTWRCSFARVCRRSCFGSGTEAPAAHPPGAPPWPQRPWAT